LEAELRVQQNYGFNHLKWSRFVQKALAGGDYAGLEHLLEETMPAWRFRKHLLEETMQAWRYRKHLLEETMQA
jgi:hypothetical protein